MCQVCTFVHLAKLGPAETCMNNVCGRTSSYLWGLHHKLGLGHIIRTAHTSVLGTQICTLWSVMVVFTMVIGSAECKSGH